MGAARCRCPCSLWPITVTSAKFASKVGGGEGLVPPTCARGHLRPIRYASPAAPSAYGLSLVKTVTKRSHSPNGSRPQNCLFLLSLPLLLCAAAAATRHHCHCCSCCCCTPASAASAHCYGHVFMLPLLLLLPLLLRAAAVVACRCCRCHSPLHPCCRCSCCWLAMLQPSASTRPPRLPQGSAPVPYRCPCA